MTEQELEDIKERLLQNKYLLPDQYKNIIAALDKQIPKKITLKDVEFYNCPSCGIEDYNNPRENGSFCKHCGQKLDWRTNND